MGQLEDDVRTLIEDRYKSLAEFARSIDIPAHTLYSVLNGDLANATLNTVMPIVKALDLDPTAIVEGRLVTQPAEYKSSLVPLYESISAGTPREPSPSNDAFPIPAELHAAYPDAFMLRVDGNSMNRILPDGFFALVDPCTEIEASGQMYAVAIDDEDATIKHVLLHDNGITLAPDSHDPTYKPRLFDYGNPDTSTVSVIGRVVWFCPPVTWATSI